MENTARLYNCVRCHHQVTICSHCDRGNIYCGKSCADSARRTSLRAAGRRYQNSRRGRLKHADRQRHYRSRRKKVTHHSSPESPASDPLITRSEQPEPVVVIENKAIRSLPAMEVRSTRRVAPVGVRRDCFSVVRSARGKTKRASEHAVQPFEDVGTEGFPARKSGVATVAVRPGHK